jgi:nucleoside-diphosphate-sugar epimerase
MRVLVTGGSGFIGSHLVTALLDRGDEVSVIDDLSTGLRERLAGVEDRIRLVIGDIRDPARLDEAIEGADAVLHEAAIPSVARSVRDPLATNSVNTGGTIEVMLAAGRAGCRRLVFAGSSAVYGLAPEMPRRETYLPDPRSPYAASKLAAEAYIHAMGPLLGVETVVLRYFNIFGPGQDPASEYAAVVPRFITATLRGEGVEVHGDGLQSRDFTHVANVVSANLLALDMPGVAGLTCNIGCGGRYTLLELIAAIEAAAGRRLTFGHGPSRAGDVPHSQAAIDVAREHLGYGVVVPFEEGIHRTVAWYAANTNV